MKYPLLALFLFAANALCWADHHKSPIGVDGSDLIFSGPRNLCTDPQLITIFNQSRERVSGLRARISGENADAFRVVGRPDFAIGGLDVRRIGVAFCPSADQAGKLEAFFEMTNAEGKVVASVRLRGLAATGIEGKGEVPLAEALRTLEMKVDIGWTTLGSNTKPDLMGEEIAEQTFRKAGEDVVTIKPIIRYSPDFPLPFGYYDASSADPRLKAIGTLAVASPTRFEQNCLFPSLESGTMYCDPEYDSFGIFTLSPTHVAYTQDSLNASLEPGHVAHAARIYPARDADGKRIAHSYLVCFEEAKNGDYQDYVFLVSNVEPVK